MPYPDPVRRIDPTADVEEREKEGQILFFSVSSSLNLSPPFRSPANPPLAVATAGGGGQRFPST